MLKAPARNTLIAARDLRNLVVGQGAAGGSRLSSLEALVAAVDRFALGPKAAFEAAAETAASAVGPTATLDAKCDLDAFERAVRKCTQSAWDEIEQLAGLPSERRAVTLALAALTRSMKPLIMQQQQQQQPHQQSAGAGVGRDRRPTVSPGLSLSADGAAGPPAAAVAATAAKFTAVPALPFSSLNLSTKPEIGGGATGAPPPKPAMPAAPSAPQHAPPSLAWSADTASHNEEEEEEGEEGDGVDDDHVGTSSQTVVRMSMALDALQRALDGAGLGGPVVVEKKSKKPPTVPTDLRAWLSGASNDDDGIMKPSHHSQSTAAAPVDGHAVSHATTAPPPVEPVGSATETSKSPRDGDGGAPIVPSNTSSAAFSKQMQTRTHVAREFLETERSFLGGLQLALDTYHGPMSEARKKEPGLCSDAELSVIFDGTRQVIAFSRRLLARLQDKLDAWAPEQSTLGDVFNGLAEELGDTFAEYVRQYAVSDIALKDCLKRGPFAFFYAKLHAASVRRNDLPDLLITPVQRVPRYLLLLKELQKQTPDDHCDSSLIQESIRLIGKAASKVNNAGRFGANFQKLRDIEALVQGMPSPLAALELPAKSEADTRTFLLEDDFTRMEDARRVRLFLMSDLLLVVKYASRYGRLKRKVTRQVMPKLASSVRFNRGADGSSGSPAGSGTPVMGGRLESSANGGSVGAPHGSPIGGGGGGGGGGGASSGSSQLPFKFLFALDATSLRAEGSQELAIEVTGLPAKSFISGSKANISATAPLKFVLVAKTASQRQLWLEHFVKSGASAVSGPKETMVLAMVRACLGRASAGVDDYKEFMKKKYESELDAPPDKSAPAPAKRGSKLSQVQGLSAVAGAAPPLASPTASTSPSPGSPSGGQAPPRTADSAIMRRQRSATMPSQQGPLIRPKPLPRIGGGGGGDGGGSSSGGSAVAMRRSRRSGADGSRAAVGDLLRLVREVKPAAERSDGTAALRLLAESLAHATEAVRAWLTASERLGEGQPLLNSSEALAQACNGGVDALPTSEIQRFMREIATASRKLLAPQNN